VELTFRNAGSLVDAVHAAERLLVRASREDRLHELFAADVVVIPSPWLVRGTYRPYLGLAGLREWIAVVREHWPDVRWSATTYRVIGSEVLVLGTISLARPHESWDHCIAWVWSWRDGKVAALRSFRYPHDALAELRVSEPLPLP
jgi:hypothetical protein